MPLIPLDIPAGFFRTGTDFEASGRWRDGNLVRWRNGSLRPVGGWNTRVSSAFAAAPRGMLAWTENDGDRDLAAGTWEKLYYINEGGTVTDITPAGFTTGRLDGGTNTGYGGGLYGDGLYGTPRSDTSSTLPATTWSLDTWGEYLVGVSSDDNTIYEWQLDTGVNAAAISNAPTADALVVTEERFLFALGAGGDPKKVQWSDREDNTTWAAADTNQAGSQILQTNGRIMQGIRARGATLILTDVDAHEVTFRGGQFVYGFERVGASCGAVSRLSAVSVDEGVFWMGDNGFFRYAGGQVEPLVCEVHDYVFADLNVSQQSKVWGVSNNENNEIWWFFPSEASTEIDRYVAYNYRDDHWLIGELNRTAGVPAGVFDNPIYADDTGDVYDHEFAYNYGGDSVYAETGPISLGAGDNVMDVTYLYPDEDTQGDAQVKFKTRYYPNGTETEHGPYSTANPTSVRFNGRQVRMRAEGVALSDWNVGTMRIEAKQRGLR